MLEGWSYIKDSGDFMQKIKNLKTIQGRQHVIFFFFLGGGLCKILDLLSWTFLGPKFDLMFRLQ